MFRKKLQSTYTNVDKVFQETVGFRLSETSFAKVVEYLYRERDASSLGVTRMLFGLTMLLDIPEERGGASMDRRWGDPRLCHFPLLPFLRALLMPHMALVYITMWLGAVGVMLGYRYRLSSVAFAAPYWYILLVEKSFWNNHSYLFGLVALLLSTTQANRYLSVDAYMTPSLRERPVVPQWNYTVLKYQFFILYFVAGVKKGSAEWLSGYAMTNLSRHWVFDPFRVFLTPEQTDYLVVHWFAFVFDLTVAFWMSWRRTRTLAMLFCAAFHLMNTRLFSIGMFPWVCLATMPLFYPVDWPKQVMSATHKYSQMILRKIALVKQLPQKEGEREDAAVANDDKNLQKHTEVDKKASFKQNSNENNKGVEHDKMTTRESRKRQLVTCSIFIYMIVQAFLPFSHFITKGYNNWANGLYGYSWDMMVYSWDTILVVVKVVDNDKQTEHYLQPGAWTPNDRWTRHADMVHQYAHCIKRNVIADIGRNEQAYNRCGDEAVKDWDNLKTLRGPPPNISMYIDVWCSMNGRFQQRMFDPKVDLLQAKWSPFAEVEWLMPLLTDYTNWRGMLAQIRREVKSWNNHMDTAFVADFPGYHLQNFIAPELTNVTLTVLDGQVVYEPAVLQSEYKGLDEGFSVRLTTGESAPILSNQFHTVHAVGDTPACYVYTFRNDTGKIYPQNVPAGVKTEKLPIWKEISARAKNMMTFFKLVGASLLQIFEGILTPNRAKNSC